MTLSLHSPKGRHAVMCFLPLAVLLMVIVAYDIFPKATKLMLLEREEMPNAVPLLVGLTALYGFLIPIFGHMFPIIISMIRNDYKRHNKRKVDEQFTVNDEEDCLSCDTCNKEEDTESNQNNQDGVMGDTPTSEHTALLPTRTWRPPRYIRTKNGGQYSEYNDQSSMSDISQNSSCDYRGIVSWRSYLFMHGLFIGTTIMSSSKLDETLVVACTVALVHGIYLERHINFDVADNRTFFWLRGVYLVSGGTTATVIGKSNVALGIVLAVAGGLYVNLALTMVIYQVKQLMSSRSQSTQDVSCYYCSKLDASHHHYQTQSMGLDTSVCFPTADDKSRQQRLETPRHIAIPSPKHTENEHIPHHLIRKYDSATWRMYNRIRSAREARAKCQICFGSLQDSESTTAIVGETREEERLIQTCPSPLYQEEDAETSIVNVHQECYYGSTIEQHTVCPRKFLLLEDNHIFHLDL